jgi:cytochrome c-type biogenesis protein CcmH/NrfF
VALAGCRWHADDAPGGGSALRAEARSRIARAEEAIGARVEAGAKRVEAMAEARSALAAEVAASLAGTAGLEEPAAREARAREIVAAATEEAHLRREEYLFDHLMCWCPHCDWAKTVAGCGAACSETQKQLVRTWIEEGLTDQEVYARMTSDPRGGPRVVALPETLAGPGLFLPLLGAGIALVLVVVIVFRMARKTPPLAEPAVPAEGAAIDEARWADEIERELKEMGS